MADGTRLVPAGQHRLAATVLGAGTPAVVIEPSFGGAAADWAAVAADLARLQDRLPPFPGDEALRLIEAEFGTSADTLFATFDPVPIAAASIAQVHFARTIAGDEVAVKILRPGIARDFARGTPQQAQLDQRHQRIADRQHP